MISLRGVGLTFARDGERTEVLRDLDLDVAPGRFITVLGPSGVGKSTLLRVIAGLLPPSAGEAKVNARAEGSGSRWRSCSRTQGYCRGAPCFPT